MECRPYPLPWWLLVVLVPNVIVECSLLGPRYGWILGQCPSCMVFVRAKKPNKNNADKKEWIFMMSPAKSIINNEGVKEDSHIHQTDNYGLGSELVDTLQMAIRFIHSSVKR